MTTVGRDCDTYRRFPSPAAAAQTSTGSPVLSPVGRGPAGAVGLCAGLDGTQGGGAAPPGTGGHVPTGAEWEGDRWGPGVHTAAGLSTPGLHAGAEDEARGGAGAGVSRVGGREADVTRAQQTTRIGKGGAREGSRTPLFCNVSF